MRSLEQLTEEILSLPSASRALLADRIVESLEFDTDYQIQKAWIDEAKKRHQQIINGEIEPIPGEEGLAQIRRLMEQ